MRLGAGISEIIYMNLIFSFQLFGFVIKISDEAGTVVLPDSVDYILAELVLFRNFNAFFDMGNQDQAGHGRGQFVVFIFAVLLIFNEIKRFINFADIMIVPADFGKQVIGTDFGCGGFHQGADDYRVMIGARRFDHEPSKNRPIQICQLEQGNIRRIAESDLNQGNDAGGHYACADSTHKAESPVI